MHNNLFHQASKEKVAKLDLLLGLVLIRAFQRGKKNI
jgi:hypothetical protein